MQVLSAYLLAASTGAGHQGNILTPGQQNLSNWNIVGWIENEYLDEVNNLVYNVQTGGFIGPDGVTYKRYVRLSGENNFEVWSNYRMACCEEEKTPYGYGIWLWSVYFLEIEQLSSRNGTFYPMSYPYGLDELYLREPGSSTPPAGNWGAWASLNGADGLPVFSTKAEMKTYLQTPDNPQADVSLTVSVVEGRAYRFSFMACSPTGFSYLGGATYEDVTVTSGANKITTQLDHEASETMKSYALTFIAGADTATMRFNFLEMTLGTDIEFLITDLELTEV